MHVRNPIFAPPIRSSAASGRSTPLADVAEAKSAARLAAESAFDVSRFSDSQPAPTVTVRRAKGAALQDPDGREADAPVLEADTAPLMPAGGTSSQGPRVFRLVQGSSQAEPGSPRAHASSTAVEAASAAQVGKPRKKRTVLAVQRPGPVVQIFKAPESVDAGAGAANPADAVVRDLTHGQLAALADMLASVQPILDDIQRARGLQF